MQQLPEYVKEMLTQVQQMHRSQRLSLFVDLNKHVKPGSIVFIGDSITEGFPVNELLQCDSKMYNRGVGGDRTEDVLKLLEDVVYPLKPNKVFLLIGTNDLGYGSSPMEVVKNIQEITVSIKRNLPETALLVQSVYPVNRALDEKPAAEMVGMRNNRDIQLINHLLREASLTERFTYIDMYSKLVDVAGLLHAEYTYDGLHLTVKGYEIVSDELQKYL